MQRLRNSGSLLAAALVAGVLSAPVSAFAQAKTDAKPAAAPAKPAAAPAKPAAAAKPNAEKLFAEGEAALKKQDYATALAAFRASNEAKEQAKTWHEIAFASDKLTKYDDAVAAYEKYLASFPVADPASKKPVKKLTKAEEAAKADAESRLAAIKATPAKVHVSSTPAGASISVDGKPTGKVTPFEIEMPAGAHIVALEKEGFIAQSHDLSVTYGAERDLALELKEVPPPPPPPAPPPPPPVVKAPEPPPPPPEKNMVPAYVTGGIAVAALGVGTGFGIAALSKQSDYNKSPTQAGADKGENYALVADMAFGVAITFGVTSAVLFFTDDAPKKDEKPAASGKAKAPAKASIVPTPWITPQGGGAGALVRF